MAKKKRKTKRRRSIGSHPRLIGVIHLEALPGAPGAASLSPSDAVYNAGARAIAEAQLLEKAGFEAVIVENFGDAPFYAEKVPPETIAAMTLVCAAVRESVKIPVGINVLRNDAHAALAIASVSGASFIRVNVLSGVAAADQGWLVGDAAHLIRERTRLGAPVQILADVWVKHAVSLSTQRPEVLAVSVEELYGRAGADGVILTGPTTGRPVDADLVEELTALTAETGLPCYLGSGVSSGTLSKSAQAGGVGVIVGSDLRKGGLAGAPLDSARVTRFVKAWKAKPSRNSGNSRKKKTKKTKRR